MRRIAIAPWFAMTVGACGADKATGLEPVATVSLSATSLSLKIGDTQTLTASLSDAKGRTLSGRTITWSVTDQAIAQVSATGTLTAVAPGQTTVTAQTEGKIATASLIVLTPPRVSIKTSQTKVFVGDTAVITWTSESAVTCTRTGSWSGVGEAGGQDAYVADAGGVKTFGLSCTGPGGTASASAKVIVPLPVYPTSYENAKKVPPLLVPRVGVRSACANNDAAAYGDFLQEGTTSLFVHGSLYDSLTPGTMCFWRRTAQDTWQDATQEVLQDQRGCLHPRKAVVADFNRDRRPDIYTACHGWDYPPYPGERSILLMSTSTGKYNRIELPEVGFTHGASAADVNGDGYPDVLFMNSNKRLYYVLLNDRGTGTFTRDDSRLPNAYLAGRPWYTTELVDIDLDGNLDIFVAGGDSDGPSNAPASVLWGDRDGRFTQRAPLVLPREPGCQVTEDMLLQAGHIYLLRECSVNKGYALQKVSIAGLSSVLVADGKTAGDWYAWIFPVEGKLYLGRLQNYLRIDP
ncbi:MAG TPA: FG-GAP-like repeat-containing protein [Gemmatimonadaceae bacterium]|nr:FG-GAP-like repeat-containing protein [Gemmatimonadaceae bacterium]